MLLFYSVYAWRIRFRRTRLQRGHLRYRRTGVRNVLFSGGHIAGIVNPPSPKAWYETAEAYSATVAGSCDPARRVMVAGLGHLGRGTRRAPESRPPALGSAPYPVLGEVPGDYVRS